ncbi:hypothetical protein SZ55_0681 [Pseudomonas sp. FeS53a]|nr:hypothetical protein SZ55_0681 [Pseudomonas sp. FeS53a]
MAGLLFLFRAGRRGHGAKSRPKNGPHSRGCHCIGASCAAPGGAGGRVSVFSVNDC